MKEQYNKTIKFLKNNLNDNKKPKKILILTMIIIIAYLLIINVYTSYAYYHSDATFPLINAVVGITYEEKYDYVVLMYKEEVNTSSNNEKTYNLVNEIPTEKYTYNNYKCQNDSVVSFDEKNQSISIISNRKDVCSVYFNYNVTGE